MSSKSRAELEYELGQVTTELGTTLAELEKVKKTAGEKVKATKKRVKEEALKAEAKRREEFKNATAEYADIMSAAKAIQFNLKRQDKQQLGVAGNAALEAQLNLLQEVFGDL